MASRKRENTKYYGSCLGWIGCRLFVSERALSLNPYSLNTYSLYLLALTQNVNFHMLSKNAIDFITPYYLRHVIIIY